MYNRRYRNCCCQKDSDYDEDTLETACNQSSATSEYSTTTNKNSCDCGFEEDESVFPQNPMFGQSYVPIQTMNKTFIPSAGLKMGTIFPELVYSYVPCQSVEENAFIKAMNTIGEGCNK